MYFNLITIIINYSWVLIYGMLLFGMILLFLFFYMTSSYVFISGFTKLHSQMLSSILTAPLSFFHTNPSGRIINRFSKDQGIVDFLLINSAFEFTKDSVFCLGAIAVMCVAFPYLVIIIFFLFFLMLKLKNIYILSSREIKRFDGITKSPINELLASNIKVINTLIIIIALKDK